MGNPYDFSDDRPKTASGEREPYAAYDDGSSGGSNKPFLAVSLIGALLGSIFAAISTSDFVSHLDRQVHSIHCSFIPGASAEIGESGCRTVMMSPYSSLFRSSLWGGLPISLLALGVFAYLVMRSSQLLLARDVNKRHTLFLVAATLLPVVMSLIYGFIAMSRIGAVCKLCVGIYLASAVTFVGALLAHMKADPDEEGESPMGLYGRWFGEGVLYVAILAIFYALFVPVSDKTSKGCGTLVKKDDGAGILVPLGKNVRSSGTRTPAIAVLDPLCPACKGFDERMRASDLYRSLDLQAALFPLDASCNWMVKESVHPGACAVSEAMLCDKEGAQQILDYAFAHQEELRESAKTDDARVRTQLEDQFPKVKGCLGSPKIKNQVNKSLRWAVSNALAVLTPQLFVGDRRVCDEDTDLGLEYTVSKLIEAQAGGADKSSEKKAR